MVSDPRVSTGAGGDKAASMGVHELAQSERRDGRRRRKALVVEGYLTALSPVPPLLVSMLRLSTAIVHMRA